MKKWQRILYHPNLPLGEEERRVTASAAHAALSKAAALEGMVLLKNEKGILPLKKGTRVALFGKGTFDYVKGGGGSGDVIVKYVRNLHDGLTALGNHVSIEPSTTDFYRQYVQEQYRQGGIPGLIGEPELPEALYEKARAFADTAVISISRFSDEYWDRVVEGQTIDLAKMPAKYAKNLGASQKIFANGDFCLSDEEAAMVAQVKKRFAKVVVVLNVGGVVDTQWFHGDPAIQSVLLAGQGGLEGGAAAAEMLCGLANPSGKLSDTFAKKLSDYPSSEGFHESVNYVDYTEDIYVGYRYFETLAGAAEKVNYPFGYGLSYTTFDWHVLSAAMAGEQIAVTLRVTNTGDYAGKEVFQLYVEAPQGKLGKAKRSLVAFQKTRLLAPGQEQTLVLRVKPEDMASYDDLGKVAKSAYMLEKGEYRFHVGTSVRDTVETEYRYVLEEDRVTEQLSAKLVPTSLKHRLLSDGSYEPLPQGIPNDPNETALEPMDPVSRFKGDWPGVRGIGRIPRSAQDRVVKLDFNWVAEGKMSLDDFVAGLGNEELAHLLGGQPNLGVANTWGIGNLPEYSVPNIMTADGPAGLRLKPETGVTTTAFPTATLLCCTWNPEITRAVGEAGAREVKENNLAMWLTPAVNIHRNPLCGRNFEYYSEDPLLAGKMAAGMVEGIQSQHIAPAVKHFALNNKETNRKDSDSRISERAAREIYLKVFEIIVKQAKPWGLMTAYNIVNGHRASENRELLEGILREEWGFDGVVVSDWWTYGDHYKETNAGNDVKMPSGYPERLLAALEAGVLTRETMEVSAKRVLSLILKFD